MFIISLRESRFPSSHKAPSQTRNRDNASVPKAQEEGKKVKRGLGTPARPPARSSAKSRVVLGSPRPHPRSNRARPEMSRWETGPAAQGVGSTEATEALLGLCCWDAGGTVHTGQTSSARQDRSDRTKPGSPSHRGLQRPTCAWKSVLRTRGA